MGLFCLKTRFFFEANQGDENRPSESLHIQRSDHDVQISPSIGIAVLPRDGHNIEILSRHADAAMYQSKRSGRGRYTSPIPFNPFVYRAPLCQPLIERIKQAFFLESAVLQDMFRALEKEGFVAVDDDHYLGIREILSSRP